MDRIWLCLLAVCQLVSSGCLIEGFRPERDKGIGPLTGRNNSAILENPVVAGPEGINDLVQVVPINSPTRGDGPLANDELIASVFDATISRPSILDTSGVTIQVSVQNATGVGQCLVFLNGLEIYGRSGALLAAEAEIPIAGSMGVSMAGGAGSCLAASEIGYALTVHAVDYDDVDHLEYDDVTFFEAEFDHLVFRQPAALLLPQTFTYDPGSSLSVDFSNVGLEPAVIYLASSRWVILDDSDRAIFWGGFRTLTAQNPVPVDGGGVLLDENAISLWRGPLRRVRVFISFEDLSVGGIGGTQR